jgi:hypothetical protein
MNEKNGDKRNIARHGMPDFKNNENIIKLKMRYINTIIKNVKINYRNGWKESS